MVRTRWLLTYLVTALFAATPAWSQCTATDTDSLNAAIEGACSTITLGKDIQLMGNVAPIDRNLTIDGGGFTIDGGGQFQALQVTGGTVAINNLTVNDALAQGSSGGSGLGGGLFVGSGATVTADNVALTNNEAVGGNFSGVGVGGSGSGGGIYNAGSLTLNSATVTGNTALGGAGGTGANGGNASGGGIYNAGSLTLNNTTVAGNTAMGGLGGQNGGTGGDAEGGGLFAENGNGVVIGATTISNNTISGNQAVGGPGTGGNGQGSGGGIYVTTGNISLSPSTVSGNQALAGPVAGGGGLTKEGPGTLTLSGPNTYTGTTQVNQGILTLTNNNALGSGTVTVASGGTLDLNATSQTVGGSDLSGTIGDTLDGTSVGDYGVLDTTGTVMIMPGSTLDVSVCKICFALAVGDQFDIMSFEALSGDFSAFSFDGNSCTWLPSGSGGSADCGGGLDFLLSEMSDSHSDDFYQLEVTNTATVPEPGTLPLTASAIFVLLLTRRVLKA